MFMLYLLSGILAYAHKIPFIGRMITLLSLWYGRTTWWKILVKLRKLFIIFNAVIGVIMVYKTVGFSGDNLVAGFAGMGHTYFEILANFTKRLFNWFVELFDHKIIPNVPDNNPKPHFWSPRGIDYSWYNKLPKLENIPNDFVKNPFINVTATPVVDPWYKSLNTWLWIGGILCSVGVLYTGYKFLTDPSFLINHLNMPDPTGPTNPGPNIGAAQPDGGDITLTERLSNVSKAIGGLITTSSIAIRNNLNPYNWFVSAAAQPENNAQLQSYSIKKLLLTNKVLEAYINHFWSEIFVPIQDTKHLMLMCKVEFNDPNLGYRTLGQLRRVNFSDKELFIEYLSERLGLLDDAYVTHPISKITFTYFIKEGSALDNRRLLQDLTDKSITTHRFHNLNLPISMEPSEYGEVIVDNYVQIDGQNIHRFIVKNGNRLYRIDVSKDKLVNHVTIEGNIDLSWVDTKIGEGIFTREIKKSTIYFMDGEIVLRKQVLPAKPFRKLIVDNGIINNFFTMDIETVPVASGPDCKLTPYLICAYNGNEYITSYGKDQKDLFATFFNKLLFTINSGTTLIYAHNLSGFDGIFLLKQLLSYGKVEPMVFNGKLMSIKLSVKGSNKVIIFKDSYLLLPLALRSLCVAFKLSVPKGYFPFKLTNIFYTGVLPKFEYWTGISLEVFNSIKNEYKGKKMWSFQQEAIKYCKLDCQTLHEILVKFNELIFNEFKVDSHKALTLPALAMRIYKTHYMPENTIYQLLGKAERNIRNSYTGCRRQEQLMYIFHIID